MIRFRGMNAFLFAVAFAGCLFSCSHHVLTIDYTLPEGEQVLKGVVVSVDFQDGRSEKELLDGNAKRELRDFTGKVHFSVSQAGNSELVGIYDLEPVFVKTVARRLESMGAVVAPSGEAKMTVRIVLQDFRLRFEERTWKVSIGYETQLLAGGEVKARETVHGSAERVKIIGTADADKVAGELYSDVMNKLDFQELFKKAGYGA